MTPQEERNIQKKKAVAKANRQNKMTVLYFALLVLAGVAIIWHLVTIQWVEGEFWREKSDKANTTILTVPATRGNIYSSDGSVLVSTIKVCDLWIDFGDEKVINPKTGKPLKKNGQPVMTPILPDTSYSKYIDEICDLLYDAFPSKSPEYFKERLEKGHREKKRCFNIAKNVPYSTWQRICKLQGWRRSIIKNVDGESVIREKRSNTYGNLALNVIGTPNSRELRTFTGLEGAYDSILKGHDGCYMGRRLNRTLFLPTDIDDTVRVDSTLLTPVINGCHIISTIDTRYQDVAENALCKMLRRYGGASGCAVLMDIETGRVLACSNVVRDSLNSRGYSEAAFNNVALSHIYEPGSTFKTVILTAMLNDHMVDTTMRVRTGYKKYSGIVEIQDSRGHSAADTVSIKNAFIHSSNVGFAEMGYKHYLNQRQRLVDSVKAIFPYMEDGKLHLDLNDQEYASHITDPNRSLSDFLHFCYGYANMVSPMQVLTFYNALGHPQRNMVKPMFCQGIINGRDTIYFKPQLLKKNICSAETQAIITDLLTNVVEIGTATNLRNDTYLIAGKTGTANTIYTGGKSKQENNNGSFVGFFPANNPKYSCIVVGEGIGSMNGRQTAVVFKEIADCVMAMDKSLGNFSLEHKIKELEEKSLISHQPWAVKAQQDHLMRTYGIIGLSYATVDSAASWVTFVPAIDSINVAAHYEGYSLPKNQIPNCVGMTARDAVALLKSMGLKVRIKGCGHVKSQLPLARAALHPGTLVTLELGN